MRQVVKGDLDVSKDQYLAIVVDNCCIVLLKEMYLNTFSHAKKTLIAKILFWRSFHQARVEKSPG